MTPLEAHGDVLFDQRDDDKSGFQKYSKNNLGLRGHPPVGLMVETRPTLHEELHCAPLLVQDDPELR